jgi:hypothetical protein
MDTVLQGKQVRFSAVAILRATWIPVIEWWGTFSEGFKLYPVYVESLVENGYMETA